jgi:predicted amidohydrolase YtcJ
MNKGNHFKLLRTLKRVSAGVLLAGLSSVALASADLVLVNADVRTANPEQARAQALAVKDGKFIRVGSEREVKALIGADTRVVDLEGKTVIPGLVDGHTHLQLGIELVQGVVLYGLKTKQEWLDAIAEADRKLPPGMWLLGGRWDYTLGENGVLPTREDLDAIVPDRPVMLRDIDYHSAWVNSKVLELAGITADTPSPEGGEIVKDASSGQPSGILKETAMGLVMASAPFSDNARNMKLGLRDTVRYVNSMGITSVHDMASAQQLQQYLQLMERDELSLRVWFGAFANMGEDGDSRPPAELMRSFAGERDKVRERVSAYGSRDPQGPLLQFGYVKVAYDGVLSTYTAALKAPYSDRPSLLGDPFFAQAILRDMVAQANSQGFPVAVHAIGDRSVSHTLDAFAASTDRVAYPNRIEHIEVLDPEDTQRFHKLDVTASMQPNHGVAGDYILERIGTQREPHAYAWKSMLNNGVNLVLGSDWPTAMLDPLSQLGDAVLRERRGKPWQSHNALTFDEALFAYTQAGANMTGWGSEIGSIALGKWADFVILDGTLPRPLDASIRQRRVAATYLAGEPVYQVRQSLGATAEVKPFYP